MAGSGVSLADVHQYDNFKRWQSITEEAMFLQDGLLRSIDLISNEFDIKSNTNGQAGAASAISSSSGGSQTDCEPEDLLKLGMANTEEIHARILKFCSRNITPITTRQVYLVQALGTLWLYKYCRARPNSTKFDNAEPLITGGLAAPSNNYSTANIVENNDEPEVEVLIDPSNLSSKLSLLLMIPLLKAHAVLDEEIARTTTSLLLEMLGHFQPMSLLKDIPEPLDTLENLLCEWIAAKGQDFQPTGPSALVALTTARGLLSSFLKTFNLLQEHVDPNLKLPVGKFLKKLEGMNLRRGEPCTVQKYKRVTIWPFDDQLNSLECGTSTLSTDSENPETEATGSPENLSNVVAAAARRRSNTSVEIARPTLTTDGQFLYISGSKGKGLTKIGTGYEGTLQAWIYNTNKKFDGGFLAFGNNLLLSRSTKLDGNLATPSLSPLVLAEIICPVTLTTKGIVSIRPFDDMNFPYMTVGFTSDGNFFYLLRVGLPLESQKPEVAGADKNAASGPLPVYVDVFQVCEKEGSINGYVAIPTRPRITISKNMATKYELGRNSNAAQVAQHLKFHPNENCITTIGITLKQLIVSYVFCSGKELTLITNSYDSESTNSTSTGTATAATGLSTLASILHQPVSTLHSRKANETTGLQIYIDLFGTAITYTREELFNYPILSYSLHNTHIVPASTYDFKHNLIWIVATDCMYAWKNPGYRPPWYCKRQFMISQTEFPQDVTAGHISNYLMMHAGMMASNFLCTRRSSENTKNNFDPNVGFSPSRLNTIIILIQTHLKHLNGTELTSIFLILQAIISQIKKHTDDINLSMQDLKTLVLELIQDAWFLKTFQFNSSHGVHFELAKLFAVIFEHLQSKEEKSQMLDTIQYSNVDENSSTTNELNQLIKNVILKHLTMKLKDHGLAYPEGVEFILETAQLSKLVEESSISLRAVFDEMNTSTDLEKNSRELPIVNQTTLYLNGVTNYFLRSWSLKLKTEYKSEDDDLYPLVASFFQLLVSASTSIVQKVVQSIDTNTFCLETYLFVENTLKSSIIGLMVPKILTFFSNEVLNCDLRIADEMANEFVSFFIVLSHLAHLMNPTEDQTETHSDDWTSQKKYSTPWHQSRYIASPHPIKENIKMKEVITIPNARKLYVKLDSECATQYDYDRLVLSAGIPGPHGTGGQVINEFGGNFYGFGGHIPGNWSNSLIGIDGDTMSFSFENRSAREHSTPDKACWGFGMTVFPKFDAIPHNGLKSRNGSMETEQEINGKRKANILPELGLVNSITLSTLELILQVTQELINGDVLTDAEMPTGHILSELIFSNFKWNSISRVEKVDTKSLNILSRDQIEYLRKASKNIGKPQMNARMKSIIKPDLLEQLLITGCVRCLTAIDINEFNQQDSDATVLLVQSGRTLTKIFQLYDLTVRQLMSLLDMQWRFENEVDDVIQKTKNMDDLFFNDSSFSTSAASSSDIDRLAFICDLQFENSHKDNILRDIRNIVNAFCLEGIKPHLRRAEDAVQETHRKCLFLATDEKRHEPQFSDNVILQWTNELGSLRKKIKLITYFILSQFNSKCLTLEDYHICVKIREDRASKRVIGIEHLVRILQLSLPNSSILDVAAILLERLCTEEAILSCANYEKRIHGLFGEAIMLIVQIATKNPLLYRFPIAVLCILPYKKEDESFLVKSGLLTLVDRLCAFQVTMPHTQKQDESPAGISYMERINLYNRASTLGWAAFQILAARCSSWEASTLIDNWSDLKHIALPVQISLNVANHLARATKLLSLKQYSSTLLTESIQDVLGLLDSLRESKLGFEILKQSPCICRLLSLLQDPGLSPRLVLIILRLLHIALPLVEHLDVTDLPQGSIPGLKKRVATGNTTTPYYVVASLLLGKLADFLICGNQQLLNSSLTITSDGKLESDLAQTKLHIWILHRDQASPKLRPLFEPEQSNFRPLNITLVDMEAKLEKDGKVLVFSSEARDVATQKAQRLAQMGFTVSLERSDASASIEHQVGTSKNVSPDVICKDKNSKLANTDPSRLFLSGEVAESMAKSIINLLRSLLSPAPTQDQDSNIRSASSSTSTLQSPSDKDFASNHSEQSSPWTKAIEDALCVSLKSLPKLVGLGQNSIIGAQVDSYGYTARLAIAALSVLGSFPETIREGLIVGVDEQLAQVNHENFFETWTNIPLLATVFEVHNSTNTATIGILSDSADMYLPSKILEVPISRLTSQEEDGWSQLPELSIVAQRQIAGCLKSLFLTPSLVKGGECPLKKALPSLNQILLNANSSGAGPSSSGNSSNTPANETRMIYSATTLVRLIAELKARAAHVCSLWLTKRTFVAAFLGLGSETDVRSEFRFPEESQNVLKSIKLLSNECKPSCRLGSVENQVAALRLLQRDSTKPPRLASPLEGVVHWDYKRQYPPIRKCIFSNFYTGVKFCGDASNTPAENPRGVFLIANIKLRPEGTYFEIQIQSLGEVTNDSIPSCSIGFVTNLPNTTTVSGAWQIPSGSIMIHSNGRLVHYNGASLINWRSERIEDAIKVGDKVGIGWETIPGANRHTAAGVERPRYTSTPRPLPQRGVRPRPASTVNLPTSAPHARAMTDNPNGLIFVTVNGVRQKTTMPFDVGNSAYWLGAQLQKSNVEILTNFGNKALAYAGGEKLNSSTGHSLHQPSALRPTQHRYLFTESEESMVNFSESLQEMNEHLGHLVVYPFPYIEQTESELSFLEAEHGSESNSDTISDTSSHNSILDSEEPVNFGPFFDADDHVEIQMEGDEGGDDSSPQELPGASNQLVPALQTRFQVATAVVEFPPSPQLQAEVTLEKAEPDSKSGETGHAIVAKANTATEYSYTSASEYHLTPSSTHDIRVFSGPNRNLCPCASNSSDCEDQPSEGSASLSSGPEVDLNDLLVRAWETRVFPVIRRRFRNESERREGLDQIRGALNMGMADIARQTVEYLYEEGSAMPRDLHFPTLEEIREESNKFTMNKVHTGMHVSIRQLNSDDDTESLLPKFAVPQMLRTFGRSGDVLEIDESHDIVLVEAYVSTEGLLSRFWYPVKYLERAKQNSSNTNSMNMFKLHSNLVSLETTLSQLYCRRAFLTLLDVCGEFHVEDSFNHIQPFTQAPLASLKLFHQIDLYNLQLRSLANFREMPPNGDLFSWNLEYENPTMSFLTDTKNPTNLFYSDSKKLNEEICAAIEVALEQGPDAVNDLTNQINSVFETEGFGTSEIQLVKEGNVEISLPEAAFSILTFRRLNQKSTNQFNGKSCLHVCGFNGSDFKKYPLACFPIKPLHGYHSTESGSIALGRNKDPKYPLPSIMTPTDKLSCTITGVGLKENVLKIQGIPASFPLALSYCQTFLSFAYTNPGKISSQNIICLVSKLCNFIQKTNLLPIVKEWLFLLVSDGINQIQDEALLKEFYTSQTAFIKSLFTELVFLYNKEASQFITFKNLDPISPNSTQGSILTNLTRRTSSQSGQTFMRGTAIGTSANSISDNNDRARIYSPLSSYLQSLIELCLSLTPLNDLLSCPPSLATSSKNSPSLTPEIKQSPINLVSPGGSSTPSTANQSIRTRGKIATTPQLQQGNKKIPAVPKHTRNKTLEALARKKMIPTIPNRPPATNEPLILPLKNITRLNAQETIAALIQEDPAFLQNEAFSWFHNILLSHALLKIFTWNDLKVDSIELIEQILPDVVSSMYEKTNHSRLFVICGVPDNIHEMSAETSIRRGLNQTGGIYGNEFWLSDESNDAVIEIRSGCKRDDAFEILKSNRTWYPIEDYILYPSVDVFQIEATLEIGDRRADQALSCYLRSKIFDHDHKEKISTKGEDVFSYIFTSCYAANEMLKHINENREDGSLILLSSYHLLNKVPGNLIVRFIENVKPKGYKIDEYVTEVLKRFGQKKSIFPEITNKEAQERNSCLFDAEPNTDSKAQGAENDEPEDHEKLKQLNRSMLADSLNLSQTAFIEWCTVLGKENIFALWRGLLSTGHDIRLDRTWISDTTYLTGLMINGEWTKEQDAALVAYIDNLAFKLRVPPQTIHPHEIYFEETEFINPTYQILRNMPIEFIRARCCILQFLNTNVLANLLPYFPLHDGSSGKSSVGSLLRDSRHLLFFHTKDEFLCQALQHSALGGNDFISPEITLDPVQSIGTVIETSECTSFCKAFTQLEHIPSLMFAVPPSSGSDPPLPILVKYTGEEVLGIIGSFRHFLSTAVDELKGPALKMLIKCPSSDAGNNKDSFILRPGPLTLGEEKILQYFGKFIGLCLRADAPISLDLLPATWRSLLNSTKEINDDTDDLIEADVLTASLIRSFQVIESPELFATLLTENDCPTFEWTSMNRESLVPLCPGGSNLSVSWATRDQFIRLLKKLRSKEMVSSNRVQMILAGLATIIPLPIILNLFTSPHLDLRLSGSPTVNLALLKTHTHYQVGISETDHHILYFWAVLESMSTEELRNFIKFATNQARLPVTCPCQNNKAGQVKPPNQVHVPPFPMKIAPIALPPNATAEYINKQTIRAETCLFLLRLPPYSSFQVTREQLLFACNSRDDPLSG